MRCQSQGQRQKERETGMCARPPFFHFLFAKTVLKYPFALYSTNPLEALACSSDRGLQGAWLKLHQPCPEQGLCRQRQQSRLTGQRRETIGREGKWQWGKVVLWDRGQREELSISGP